jgi:hypothetical protein
MEVNQSLPLARYRLEFTGSTRSVPLFPGSAWRGALGHELRRIACLTQAKTCAGCPLLFQCSYSLLFETPVPPDAGKMRLYTQGPHPYVLREEAGPTGTTHLYLTLVGRSSTALPLMALALIRAAAGERGVAGRRLKFMGMCHWRQATQSWHPLEPRSGSFSAEGAVAEPVPAVPYGELQIRLHTPLRVKREGHHVGPRDFAFSDLFGNLLRRISMLSSFHGDSPLETDFRALMAAAREVKASTELTWTDLPRHSARQNAFMRLGGVTGTLHLLSRDVEPFWPLLWIGQYTHAGSAATMGLG